MFSPITIGGVEIKNRLVVAPMVTNYCDQDGMPTERFIRYHEEKAKGGWGLIIIEDYAVDPAGRGFWTPGLWDDSQTAPHAGLVERLHAHGAKVIAQIYHCGRQTTEALIGVQPVSASGVPDPASGSVPRALTVPEIHRIVQQFAETSLRAKQAGFDGVEVHGAHGYLISQFMSYHANRRVDEYGGSFENRMRFPLEIIAAIRELCGDDFCVTFRISADEQVTDGRGLAETLEIVPLLEAAGIDAIHVSAGTYASSWSIIPPLNVKQGWIVDHAAAIKEVVDIPVITVGRINDPAMAESVLQSGKADMVAMARQSLADPYTPIKYQQGRRSEIRSCIACQQGCVGNLFGGQAIACMINAQCGYEYLDEQQPATEKKTIAVVGGGPAGLEAARVAADRGHTVHLYEKTGTLGGELVPGAMPPNKGEFTSYLSWAARMVEAVGVEVHLDTEFTVDLCRQTNPDHVIVATGAVAARPPITGLDLPHVVAASDLLMGRASVGKRVVVAGGGMIGSETASWLGVIPGADVTIVEMLPTIAAEEDASRRMFLMQLLTERGVKLMPSTKIVEITSDAVEVEDADGQRHTLPCDNVVLALGTQPVRELVDELEGVVPFTVVGDAIEARNVLPAVREGFLAGCAV
ncbi:FAD-dependent oxidoreductase [Propionibacteriaceae bacterium Y1923]